MAFLKEFKEFALKGNVMDMAVGVIIGGAFGKIVSSLVNDILMPPIGALIGNTDFSQLRLDISKFRDMTSSAVHAVGDVVTGGGEAAAKAAAEPVYWNYGAFIQQCIDFTILAFCVFLMVKLMNRLMRKKEEAAPAPAPEPAPTKEELLLTEIRDLLREQQKYLPNTYSGLSAIGTQPACICACRPCPWDCGKGGEPAARPGGLIGRTPFCAYTPVIYKW